MDIKKENGIILALDVLTQKKAFHILNEIYDLIDAVKINYALVFPNGIGICKEIKKKFGLPIIGDFKIADVNISNKIISDICYKNGINFLTIHGFIGRSNLMELKSYVEDRVKFFIITELTTCPNAELLPYKKNAQLALDLGFYGVQAPATKPLIIRNIKKMVGDKLKIISCGIIAQGPAVGSGIKNGADFEIIGRGIYMEKDPRATTKGFIKLLDMYKNG